MADDKVKKSEAEWRVQLDPHAFQVLRLKGTERAFTGRFWNHWQAGTYRCGGCGEPLFRSQTKFDAGCGWPSFDRPLREGAIAEAHDHSYGIRRVEVLCERCGGHLGHVFTDGPTETGLRYCINSASLTFEPDGA
ncbi:MAG: peptide-methionine (R)-S-oxide reductase MsrB [Alphaproteobacteria bacterium]|nr:peptide-methionine (R)-S-oxide reductase MsrB [Alphaproteobacteria bacterium]MCB9796837.1 peptide-methionine (R)-S-oxide reductase MsrB [Alphaproteobacteria bacterium]